MKKVEEREKYMKNLIGDKVADEPDTGKLLHTSIMLHFM